MARVRPTEDVQPLTTFRARVSSFVDQVRETRRPIILTQHGKSAAVLIGAAEYEALVDELELLKDIQVAEAEIDGGTGISHEHAERQLRARLKDATK